MTTENILVFVILSNVEASRQSFSRVEGLWHL